MKKSKLTLLLVLCLTGFVPVSGFAQMASGAKSEPVATKQLERKKAESTQLALAEDAPTTYTVVKGDTLWGISGRFLKEPWRWPEIWNMNREQVKDPHWIYPGDVIKLSFDTNGKPVLSVNGGSGGGFGGVPGGTVKLNPQIRTDKVALAIPSIPSKVIGPFLSLPLVIEKDAMVNSPRIIAAEDGRVIIGAGNVAYAIGLNPNQGTKWQVYRPGKELVDPVTGEILGVEANYLGEARVSKFGESSTLEILRSTQEINRGDRLTPTLEATLPSYSPRAPEKTVKGAIVSVLSGVNDAAQYSVVALNLGRRDGMEIGHVLATLQKGETVSTAEESDNPSSFRLSSIFGNATADSNSVDPANASAEVKLPDERNGLAFVFRVFDKISYALIMSSRRPLKVGDVVQTP
jgi:hypothetical protein